ncbi:hypothetical protein, partial [Vibrio anguillarum]
VAVEPAATLENDGILRVIRAMFALSYSGLTMFFAIGTRFTAAIVTSVTSTRGRYFLIILITYVSASRREQINSRASPDVPQLIEP